MDRDSLNWPDRPEFFVSRRRHCVDGLFGRAAGDPALTPIVAGFIVAAAIDVRAVTLMALG